MPRPALADTIALGWGFEAGSSLGLERTGQGREREASALDASRPRWRRVELRRRARLSSSVDASVSPLSPSSSRVRPEGPLRSDISLLNEQMDFVLESH